MTLARLEQQNGNLAKIKVDEMFCFVGDIGAKVSSNHSMPGGIVFLVKFFLNKGCNIFLDIVFFQCLKSKTKTEIAILSSF